MQPNRPRTLAQLGIDYGSDPADAFLRARREAGRALVSPQAPSKEMDPLVGAARPVLATLLAILGFSR